MASDSLFRHHLKKISMVCVPRMTGTWSPPTIDTVFDYDTGQMNVFQLDGPHGGGDFFGRYDVQAILVAGLPSAITNDEGVEVELTAHGDYTGDRGTMTQDLILENEASAQILNRIANHLSPEPGDEELFSEEYTIVRDGTEVARFDAVDHEGDTHFDAVQSLVDQWNASGLPETDDITAFVYDSPGWNLRLQADNDSVPDFASSVTVDYKRSVLPERIEITRNKRVEFRDMMYYIDGDPTSPGTPCDALPGQRKLVISEDVWNDTFVGEDIRLKLITEKDAGLYCLIGDAEPPVYDQMWSQITLHYGTSVTPEDIVLDKTPTFFAWRSVVPHLKQDNTYGYIWGETVWDPGTGQFMIEVTSPRSGKKWYGGIGFAPNKVEVGELELPWIGYRGVTERAAPGMMETYVRIERRPFLASFNSGGPCAAE